MSNLNDNQKRLLDIATELADLYSQVRVAVSDTDKDILHDKIDTLLDEKSTLEQAEENTWTAEDEEKAQQDRDTMKDLEDAQV